jgi:ABC-type antimicrobial peptide transport system permease subunit
MYMSYYQVAGSFMNLTVRAEGDPTALVDPIRQILRQKDRNIPLVEPATMQSIVDASLADFRVIASSLGLLSLISLLLALVGLSGVLGCFVSQRYHEMGVRMVLGATDWQVASLVLSRGMALVGIGLIAGLCASFWATDLIRRLLFGVNSTDPFTFIVSAVGFGSVALLACLLPAWRATQADPVLTLQAE